MDKISIFYPLHVSVMNITDNIRLFQKSYGIGLVSGGDMGEVFYFCLKAKAMMTTSSESPTFYFPTPIEAGKRLSLHWRGAFS